jgi:hypothetical protein
MSEFPGTKVSTGQLTSVMFVVSSLGTDYALKVLVSVSWVLRSLTDRTAPSISFQIATFKSCIHFNPLLARFFVSLCLVTHLTRSARAPSLGKITRLRLHPLISWITQISNHSTTVAVLSYTTSWILFLTLCALVPVALLPLTLCRTGDSTFWIR